MTATTYGEREAEYNLIRAWEMLGGVPIPTTRRGMRGFCDAVARHAEKNHCVVIYPEAHIWPYYTKIRPFKDVSFRYPVEENKPVFCFTTTYQKRKFSKLPKVTVYIDGPFFPDENLSLKDNRKKLRDLVYETMLERSKNSTYEYVHYIKTSPVSAPCPEFVPSAEETKTEEEAIPVGIAV